MSMTESCRWEMQCRLRDWRTWTSNKGLRPCPLHTDFSSFSKSFDDVMHCRWWDFQSFCNLTLRNVVFKVFHNLFMHSSLLWAELASVFGLISVLFLYSYSIQPLLKHRNVLKWGLGPLTILFWSFQFCSKILHLMKRINRKRSNLFIDVFLKMAPKHMKHL